MKIEWKQCFKVGVSVFILFLCIKIILYILLFAFIFLL